MNDNNKKSTQDPSHQAEIEAQAAAWSALLYSGEATPADQIKFSIWLKADQAHQTAFRRLEQTWRDVDYAVLSDEELSQNLEELHPASVHQGRPKAWGGMIAAAGVMAASLLIAGAVFLWPAQHAPSTEYRYASPLGEIKTITLPDGSAMDLGSDTQVIADFSDKERSIKVVNGQAFFDVVRDEQRPFSVKVSSTEVRVLGTSFEVVKQKSGVEVFVVEGIVNVLDLPDRAPPQLADEGLPSARLTQGQSVFADARGTLGAVRPFEREHAQSWRQGMLVYQNAPLADIVEEVNRYRHKKIELSDAPLDDILVTVSLPIHDTDLLLSALEISEPVTITMNQDIVSVNLNAE